MTALARCCGPVVAILVLQSFWPRFSVVKRATENGYKWLSRDLFIVLQLWKLILIPYLSDFYLHTSVNVENSTCSFKGNSLLIVQVHCSARKSAPPCQKLQPNPLPVKYQPRTSGCLHLWILGPILTVPISVEYVCNRILKVEIWLWSPIQSTFISGISP